MQHRITFGSRCIDFTLRHQNRRSLRIVVHPDATVEVIAPLHAPEPEVLSKVTRKAPWILRQIDHFNSYQPGTPERRFVGGETHLYLGRQYRLKIVADARTAVKAYRGQLWMHTPNPTPPALKRQLAGWYRQKALAVFAELLAEAFPRFSRYGIATPQLQVRALAKRWGSCTRSGKIILNVALIKAPKSCIEYVIVHELCHLVYHNHTKAFRDLLGSVMPDWEERKGRLEYLLA